MPYFKCEACKTRLRSASPGDPVGYLCPGCGSLLEPVGNAAEVVGYRSITACDGAADDEAPGGHQRLAERVGDFHARRQAILAQAHVDAERWVDDGGSFRGAAVAAARPDSHP